LEKFDRGAAGLENRINNFSSLFNLTRSQSDEMRTLLSKRLSREIAEDWKEQLWQKRRLECEQQEEERMWACLNLEDMEEKV